MQLRQFVPNEYCVKCDVCCRFLEEETPYAPQFKLIPHKDRFMCQQFDPATNRCKDYENRPLDCQLYPFVVMWDRDYRNIVLGLDHKCPYARVIARGCPETPLSFLSPRKRGKQESILEMDSRFRGNDNDIDSRFILRFQDDIEVLHPLDIKIAPILNRLLIGDKDLFKGYAAQTDRPFSSYSFVASYVWAGLLDYYWTIIDDSFCLFCKTKDTIFMPLPPVPPRRWDRVKRCFKLMNEVNKNKNCSRIEDISEKDMGFFKDLGYDIKQKGCEYVFRQKDLAELAGDKYKAKRALCNYFVKNYRYKYREFRKSDALDCLKLFRHWAKERTETYKDNYYKALLEDSYFAHKKAMERFDDLGLLGRVVVVDDKISAYIFGYQLSADTFVILFEVADLKIKGLAQFISREFCRELGRFKCINLMDDSGLENLKRVKLSYHPVRIEKVYCAYG